MVDNKVKVHYQGGKSRFWDYAVDYMLADVPVDEGDAQVELYAEATPDADDETATYADLKSEIIGQARSQDIDPSILQFWYDDVLYNANQLAGYLGISRVAVSKRIKSGSLRGDFFTPDGHPLFTHDTAERLRREKRGAGGGAK